jgi:hypothetical protein
MKQLEYYIQRALQCGISDGIDIDCSDLRKPGGLYRIAWVFNKEDLRVPIDVTLAEYVTNLELNTYLGLYKFESTKFSHEATWAQQQGDGGNVSYLQTVTLRLANSNPANDKVIEDASVSELVIITRSNAGEYQIWGAENGLGSGDGTTGGAGRQATDSTFTTLVLTGTERYLPKRLLVGGTDAATLAYLNARVL